MDTDKNGAINYTEFIASSMNTDVFEDNQKIMSAFDMLDKDGDGFIDEQELAVIMGLTEYDKNVMKKLMSDVDDNSDNKIDYNEFKKMIISIHK